MMKNRDEAKKFQSLNYYITLWKKHIAKLFLLLFIILLGFNIPKFGNIHDRLHDVSVSIYSIVSYPILWVKDHYNEAKHYITALITTKNVYLENQRLKGELKNLELIITENNDLKELVNFHDNFVFSKITGRAVLESHENFHHYYLLNIGVQNGIQKGNAVVAQDRLIGRIIDVSNTFSKMQLLTSKDLKIPVSILNTGYNAVAAGLDQDEYLRLLYLTDESEIKEGQVVVTSGDGGYIPYGIYVGEVAKKDDKFYVKICTSKKLSLISVLKLNENFADAGIHK